jgi:hypothetical protein
MAALDLSGITQLPYVSSTTTPGTSNLCRIILLPEGVSLKITLHNRDKASKVLAFSFDPTLTDGGAAPATYFSVHDLTNMKCGRNRVSGFSGVTQVAVFAPSHTSVNCEILIEEDGI